jgi:hypothetical protein
MTAKSHTMHLTKGQYGLRCCRQINILHMRNKSWSTPSTYVAVYRTEFLHSTVGTGTGHGLGDREAGVQVRVESRIVTSPLSSRLAMRPTQPRKFQAQHSLLHTVQLATGPTQPPIQRVPQALSLGVRQPARETDHSPPTSGQVKKTWI